MPHCIIEYSKNLESKIAPRQLLKAVHTGAVASELFAEENIKSRVIPFTEYQTGTKDTPFIHVAAKILSGRTDEQKKAFKSMHPGKNRTLSNVSLLHNGRSFRPSPGILC